MQVTQPKAWLVLVTGIFACMGLDFGDLQETPLLISLTR